MGLCQNTTAVNILLNISQKHSKLDISNKCLLASRFVTRLEHKILAGYLYTDILHHSLGFTNLLKLQIYVLFPYNIDRLEPTA